MYDRNFDSQAGWAEQETGEKEYLPPIKKNLGKIIALVIFIAAAYFAYYYLIGSVVAVELNVTDLENKEIGNYKITITDSSRNVVFNENGSGISTTKLREGEYTYSISANGFDSKKGPLSLKAGGNSGNTHSETINLDKSSNVEITSFEIPPQVFTGQTVFAKISLKNSGKTDETIEIVFTGNNAKEFRLTPVNATIPANNSTTQTFGITAPSDIKISNQKDGDPKEIIAGIRLTAETQKAKFNLMPTPEIELGSAVFGNVNPGMQIKKDIMVRNKSRFSIPELTLSMEIVTADENPKDSVEKWIFFATEERTKAVFSLQENESKNISMVLNVPLSAKKEIILGKIILSSASMGSQTIEKELQITINSETNIKVTGILSGQEISVPFDTKTNKYQILTNRANVTLKNTGSIDVQNVQVNVENSTECTEEWLKFIDNTPFDLAKNESKPLSITISAPDIQKDLKENMICTIRYRFDYYFDDPTDTITEKWQKLYLTIKPQ